MPLEVPILAGLVALGGALLVFLGSLPVSAMVLKEWAGYEAALASQFAASIVGSLLLVMAFGLARRLRLAWGMALFLLANGAMIAWLREEAWWTWGLFILVALLLGTMRTAFYRESRLRREPLSQEMLLPLAAVAICGLALAMLANASRLQGEMWWEVVLFTGAPAQLRFTVGIMVVLLLLGMVRLLRPAPILPSAFDDSNRTRLESLGAVLPETADGVLWGEAGRAGLAFSRMGELWIGHGDPVGDPRDIVSAIWRFRDFCEREGGRPAFTGLGPDFLRIYADIGLQTLPEAGAPGRFVACDAEHDLGRLIRSETPAPPAG
jgi:phosphatidylglycerol lysyltransferase